VVIAVLVAIEVKALLVGSSAEPAMRDEIRAFIENHPEVGKLYHMITLQLGPDIVLATKARMRVMDAGGDARALVDAVNRVERELRQRFAQIRWSFFEADDSD
jgi:divalent metal cation (Fe/Co/Zn/Cd) transporter